MKRLICIFLCVLLTAGVLPFTAVAENDTVRLSSADDFAAFAKNCRSDTYSKGKTFVLTQDINLADSAFCAVPYFAGTFDGGEHILSGVRLTNDGSVQGVFRYVAEGAVVKNLTVKGAVTPGGSKETVGGIAGENSGNIRNCTFEGTVTGFQRVGGIAGVNTAGGVISSCIFSGSVRGEHEAGGIVGNNSGFVTGCENIGKINTVLMKSTQSRSFDISTLIENEFLDITDVGGIAGISDGMIQSCINRGEIGYEHTGYNVGGIAGSSSGFVDGCENRAEVYGRKDVGGIVGQMIPYSHWDFSESKLTELKNEMETLDRLIDRAFQNSENTSDRVTAKLDLAKKYGDKLIKEIEKITKTANEDLQIAADAADELIRLLGDAADAHDFSKVDELIDELSDLLDTEPENIDFDALLDVLQRLLEESTGFIDTELIENMLETVRSVSFTVPNVEKAFEYFEAAVDAVEDIRDEIQKGGDQLDADVGAVLDQAEAVYDAFFRTAENIAQVKTGYSEDVSAYSDDAAKAGSVRGCVNRAAVNADTNVGGIAGSVSFEISFDAEDELNLSDYILNDARYLIYAVIDRCESYGDVTAKKENAGGVVGNMDFGAVTASLGAGTIRVTSGDGAGGVAGRSSGTVKNSFSRALLYGDMYIGGIVGQGNDVTNCLSYSFVKEADEAFGSVAGRLKGSAADNLFVENGVGGIDGIDYAEVAEAVSYDQMLKIDGIPDVFKQIVVTFIAGDEVINRVDVPFGGSVGELPKIANDGARYWKWESFDKDHIYYSMTVEGEYKNPRTTLSTGEENPLILAEGIFYENQELTVEELRGGDSTRCRVSVNDYSGALTLRLRYEGNGELYVTNAAGKREKTEYEHDGSYIVFDMESGDTFEISEEQKNPWFLIAVLSAAVNLAILVPVVILLIKKSKKKRNLHTQT